MITVPVTTCQVCSMEKEEDILATQTDRYGCSHTDSISCPCLQAITTHHTNASANWQIYGKTLESSLFTMMMIWIKNHGPMLKMTDEEMQLVLMIMLIAKVAIIIFVVLWMPVSSSNINQSRTQLLFFSLLSLIQLSHIWQQTFTFLGYYKREAMCPISISWTAEKPAFGYVSI